MSSKLAPWAGIIEKLILDDIDKMINLHMTRLEGMADLMGFEVCHRHDPMPMRDRIKYQVCRGSERGSLARKRAAVMMREVLIMERLERIQTNGCEAARQLRSST